MKKLGPVQQKIILLLFGGLALCFAYNPKQYFKVIAGIGREWRKIEKRQINYAIRKFHETHLIYMKYNSDGTLTPVLTPEGRKIARRYQTKSIKINRPKVWDKLWRVVIFDIPEKDRLLREGFRHSLKRLGFLELQKSVLVIPFQCEKELDFLISIYNAKKFVKKMLVKDIDEQERLREYFRV